MLKPAARRARIATAVVFFLNGFGYASWVPRLAEVKGRLGLDEAGFGLALLMVATGALLAMPLTGAAINRFGSRTMTALGVGLFALPPVGLAMAPTALWLGLVFLLIGITAGGLDVAMNAQGAAAERALARPIMSSLHGMFSLGGMAGALIAGLVVGAGVDLFVHMLAVGVLAGATGPIACRVMLRAEADMSAGGPVFALPDRALLGLGLIAFCALLAEGSVADWSAVYIRESLGAAEATAAVAFAAFQMTMATGRFAGDRLAARLGRVLLVRAGALLAATGLAGALVLGTPAAAIPGFALIGAGIACIFPLTVSCAAEAPGRSAGISIAAICTLGYLGFLVGPPAIGFSAAWTGLPLALGIVVALLLLVAALARQVGETPPPLSPGALRPLPPDAVDQRR